MREEVAWYGGNATGRWVEGSVATEKGATDAATLTAKRKTATDACAAVSATGGVVSLMQSIGH